MMIRRTPVKLLEMAKGFGAVTNIVGPSNPDVYKFGNQWWMFLGCLQTSGRINLFSACLPPGAPLGSDDWSFHTDKSDPSRAAPLIEQPGDHCWENKYGLHTPSYCRGVNPSAEGEPAECERIYYTGSSKHPDGGDEPLFSIGFLEKTESGWVRHGEPILTGTPESPNVLEPKVRYYRGKWRMWYQTTPREVTQGGVPECRIKYVESDDGIGGWSQPRTLFPASDKYFDSVVTEAGGGYGMVVARPPNLYEEASFPPHGLWWLTSQTPSGDRGDWTADPVCLIDGRDGEPWFADGIFGPSIRLGDTEEDKDTLFIFFTGVSHPADPPFESVANMFLTVGRAEFSRSPLLAQLKGEPPRRPS